MASSRSGQLFQQMMTIETRLGVMERLEELVSACATESWQGILGARPPQRPLRPESTSWRRAGQGSALQPVPPRGSHPAGPEAAPPCKTTTGFPGNNFRIQ